MASEMKAKVSPMLWKKCKIAVVHYINERNIMDSMEPFHGFSTSYISNITAYAAIRDVLFQTLCAIIKKIIEKATRLKIVRKTYYV